MDEDIKMKIRMVKEAEDYLLDAKRYLEELQSRIHESRERKEKDRLQTVLEQDRIRFAQMYAGVVIFKATHGIFTAPSKDSKTN